MGLFIELAQSFPTTLPASFACCCRKFKSEKYVIYEVAVKMLVLLLLCADFSLAAQQTSQRSSISDGSLNSSVETQSNRELSEGGETPKNLKDGNLAASQKTLFFGEDTNGVPIVTGTWFRYGSYTLAFCMFGTAFLTACAASSVYYVLFVVTEPSQQRSATSENWNVGRVLRALQLAYDTYESFDPYSPACQLKTICEIQESDHFQGSMLKRLTHFMIHTDLVRKKLANADGLQAADRIGNDPAERCNDKYPDCRFSLNRLYTSYLTI